MKLNTKIIEDFFKIFKVAPKGALGVDIGTSAIKIVELAKWGNKKKLENYGEIQAQSLYQKPFRTFEKSTLSFSEKDVVRAILAIFEEAKIKTRKAYFSIPDFSTFFTSFDLPEMSKEELPRAVEFEARQHIPLPLSEVTLDWQMIGERKVLLAVVPNEIIQQYQEIARSCGLKLLALEAEVFGLARILAKEKERALMALIDIGARSTTISIVNGEFLKTSHSFDVAGNDFTNILSGSLTIDYQKAEELKKQQGLISGQANTKELLLPLMDLIISEVRKIIQSFTQSENKEIQKIIVAGGSALMPGLKEYFSQNLEKPVEIADPFSDIYYPPILEKTLKTMGPSYAIAVGAALRGIE